MNLSSLLKAATLGVVEGATEFIPVSSTGHLILLQNWLDFTGKKENAFAIFIQLGAILAVIWLYREKLLASVLHWREDPQSQRLILNLLVGTLPAAVVGLPTESWIEAHFFKPLPVSLALVLGGVAILVIEGLHRPAAVETVDAIPVKKAFGVGVIQVLSILFPGVSRSGATIMGGLLLGLSRRAATEFSFLMAIPAMVGASVVKMARVHEILTPGDLPLFSVGFGVSFITALVVIRGLLALIARSSFVPFAWYRILFGVALLAL